MRGFEYSMIAGWEYLRERYNFLWERNLREGGFISQIQNPSPSYKGHEEWMAEPGEKNYLDPGRLLGVKEHLRGAWQWHYDLFQYEIPSYGPNIFVGFCGAKPVFSDFTVWHEPFISSLDEADRMHFDRNNKYWKATLEIVDYFVEKCAGKKQLGMSDFGGPADWISAAMGTENFLIECIQRPDEMRELAMRLVGECKTCFDAVYSRISLKNDGIANWMPLWSKSSLITVQDDISVNISPSLYKEVFVPALMEMASFGEKSVLHWHGACRHHLDALLGIRDFNAVQYGHDPGTGSFRSHIGNMRKIQEAGKVLFISCVEAGDVEFFVNRLDPRGLAMIINTPSRDESKRMEELIPELTKKRMEIFS